MTEFNITAQDHILALLAEGRKLSTKAEMAPTIHEQEALARMAISYLDAANVLLGGHAQLHNDLIEHIDFMVMRRFARRWRT